MGPSVNSAPDEERRQARRLLPASPRCGAFDASLPIDGVLAILITDVVAGSRILRLACELTFNDLFVKPVSVTVGRRRHRHHPCKSVTAVDGRPPGRASSQTSVSSEGQDQEREASKVVLPGSSSALHLHMGRRSAGRHPSCWLGLLLRRCLVVFTCRGVSPGLRCQ